jgi:Type II CAAX prenyl endopeptidase Rce1-like
VTGEAGEIQLSPAHRPAAGPTWPSPRRPAPCSPGTTTWSGSCRGTGGGIRRSTRARTADLGGRQLAYQALARIPVGTVAWEETAFRGVPQAALGRVLAEPAATAAASAVFGIWHIRPTAEALAVNQLAADRGAQITAVTVTSAGTAAAGALLSLLRERSGSLAAPVLLHLAANGAALLASSLARTLGDPHHVSGRPVESG